ncbi:unnamed protein product [Lactuca virosa]|uniref:Uncharacterized protein n=1 Tax=Lactuca virosa TaxID=75947 RepID=A0AAU9PCT2_9ASTR|nr:unnamed protein product [Lactuca virosa]
MIDLQDSLARLHPCAVCISKVRESLALIQYGENDNFTTVWIMEPHGSQRSFTKLFTIKTPHDCIVGFSKNGIPIMQVTDEADYYGLAKLVVYEPNSEHSNVLEICDMPYHFSIHSYMETLLCSVDLIIATGMMLLDII